MNTVEYELNKHDLRSVWYSFVLFDKYNLLAFITLLLCFAFLFFVPIFFGDLNDPACLRVLDMGITVSLLSVALFSFLLGFYKFNFKSRASFRGRIRLEFDENAIYFESIERQVTHW